MFRLHGSSSFTFLAASAFAIACAPSSSWAQDPCLQALPTIAPGSNIATSHSADVNGDGDVDVLLTAFGSTSAASGVYLGAGNGTFAGPIVQPVSGSFAGVTSDMDGDGDLDLVSTSFENSTISVRLNRGNATFAAAVSYPTGNFPGGPAVGDLDGDGDADVVTGSAIDVTLSVHFNAGNGWLGAPVTYGAGGSTSGASGTLLSGVRLGDMDGDGDLDLVSMIDESGSFGGHSRITLRMNLGQGTFGAFVPTSFPGEISGPTLADLDGDGDLDVAGTQIIGNNMTHVFFNSGSGALGGGAGYPTNGYGAPACADVDGDGDQDLIVYLWLGGTRVMRNNGNGSFTVDAAMLVPGSTGSVVLADVVGDSRPEILSLSGVAGAGVQVYINCQTSGSRYCFGDGLGAACPCQNYGAPEHGGCANLLYSTGARLSATGTASVSSDSVVLTSESMSGAHSWYFQATGQDAIPFGRGILCISGALVRVGQKSVVGGSSTNPSSGDLSLSVKGAIPPSGGTRYYQVSYRQANPLCAPPPLSNTNRTNGIAIVWTP
jgi:hypothetical protein